MGNNGEIGEVIQRLKYDIKAEAVIADLLENGLPSESFVVVPNGTFKRRYSNDIAFTKKIKLNNGLEVDGIHVNRDGIYDTLPEGFFHQNNEHTIESKEISKESKKLKEEERNARNFFLPFENEIFTQRINLELEERKILERLSENLSDDFSPEFWRLDRSLDSKYLSRMVKFLHISYKIAGNAKLTSECLEKILDEHVDATISQNRVPVKVNHKSVGRKQNWVLGSVLLGDDFVCGYEFLNMGYTMQFEIGPLKNSNINDYLKNGHIYNFLKCFYSYFVPADFDIDTHILISQEKLNFTLDPSDENAVLGFTTAI